MELGFAGNDPLNVRPLQLYKPVAHPATTPETTACAAPVTPALNPLIAIPIASPLTLLPLIPVPATPPVCSMVTLRETSITTEPMILEFVKLLVSVIVV